MSSKREKGRGGVLRLALTILLLSGACLVGVILAVNTSPQLLVALFGLEQLGAPSDVLPPERPVLSLRGDPLDHVNLLIRPHVTEPLTLTSGDVSEGRPLDDPLIGDASRVDTTRYLITINEDSAGKLLKETVFAEALDSDRYQDVVIDIHPGGLTVYADVDLGIRQQRMGLLLLRDADGLTLSPAGVVLGGELYALPESGLLTRLLLPMTGQAGRTLHGVTVVGPLPGEAQVDAVRFGHNSLQLMAQATYASSALPDTGWRLVEEDIALREIDVAPGPERATERLSIVRLKPSQMRLRVLYDPASPKSVSAWGQALDALLVVNGSYFAPANESGLETIGLLVSDGQRWGTPLQDHAGMLAVTGDGGVSIRWLRERPYDPGEPLSQAMQSFPVLVKPGGIMGFPADADDGAPARRTVVAQDGEGNLLLIVAPRGTLSLHELAVFLAESDLNIDVALNLDGGGSSGMWVAAANAQVDIDSLTTVPSVVAVERR